ncbi:hypothetical protein F4780DRAFT_711101 [Xylariomycetidae sp. FL0641]|nr:hypothetical protein F4780DRAFT_711101 [Xylariomycetidae sp. FL0641]
MRRTASPSATAPPHSYKLPRHGDQPHLAADKMVHSQENHDLERDVSTSSTQVLARYLQLPSVTRLPRLAVSLLLVLSCSWFSPAWAVRIPFDNCLSESYIYSNPSIPQDEVQLQFVPLVLDATFDTVNPTHNLGLTVWGNVTGRVGEEPLPAPGAPEWEDDTLALNGKIQYEPFPNDKPRPLITTLHSAIDVLTFSPYINNANFCSSIVNASCPLGPIFNNTAFDLPANPYGLPSFNVSHDFYSDYAFASFAPTLIIWWGDQAQTSIGCVSATITPTLGDIAWLLKFLPLFVLILVGLATAFAGIFSPWGTSDIFHWTSNYGRDPDLLRLITPGFGDCLQYIQFVVLTGGLSLDYPGFYQPVVSQGAWSTLMFNESFVAHADPWESVVDGIYVTNETYGLARVGQLVGMAEVEDIWAGMMVWLLAMVGSVLVLIQLGFLIRFLRRFINSIPEEDLRAKNIPFSMGNVIRIVFSYFLLPIVTLSTFQLVVASRSNGVLVAMAVITLALIIGFAVRLMYLIATTKPRAHLFDDLPTVLFYGPLYNSYSDEAAAFALIPIILTIMRGLAIGAVQPSGVAQIVILAVCEVIQILTLHAFRPFHSATSMNAYHTGFSILRFLTILLMVAFAPSMGVTEGPKGWVGYAILLVHGSVLLFGFFLNALQTSIEVTARLCGAGGDDVRGQTRGGLSKIFGARQLQRRVVDRRGAPSRQSQLSTAAMLDPGNASKRGYGRVRSESAGSYGILMHTQRSSSALDARSIDAYSIPIGAGSTLPPTTPREASTFSFLPSPGQATRPQPTADPYYRPPRARRGTLDDPDVASSHRPRGSMGSVDLSGRRYSQAGGPLLDSDGDAAAPGTDASVPGPSATPAHYTPVFAPRADYSTREVDFYYGVRGPALNSDGPGRKLGTGPADPTSPITTATGWLRGLFGGKTKDKGKGFEVVRSSRMPPAMQAKGGDFSDEGPPEGIPVAMGVVRKGPIESDDDDDLPKSKKKQKPATGEEAQGDVANKGGDGRSEDEADTDGRGASNEPPLLPDLDAGESFKFPSRIHSKASRQASQKTTRAEAEGSGVGEIPEVPRKSSKRNSTADQMLGFIAPSDSQARADEQASGSRSNLDGARRLPFDRTNSQKRLSASSGAATEDLNNMPSINSETPDERPASFGYVHQRNVSQVDPEQRVDLLGSAAELVTSSRRPSPASTTTSRKS